MAILKDLIVHGSSRFLNKIYANELETSTFEADSAIIKKLKADDATVVGLLDVQGELHTNSWTNSNIATIDGSFYITPTIGSDSGTVAVTATSLVFSGSNYAVTNLYLGDNTQGAYWKNGSKVLVTGQILYNGEYIPLGTLVGELGADATNSSINIVNITTNKKESSSSTVYLSSNILNEIGIREGLSYRNLKVSLYQRKFDSSYYPLGIYLTALGESGKTFLDIYGGVNDTSTKFYKNDLNQDVSNGGFADPNVRIGNLSGLAPIITAAGSFIPQGWGIYTTNGYFKGTVIADQGVMGGWRLTSNSIYSGNSAFGNASGMYFGANGLSLGNAFQVTNQGDLTATNAHITGEITATSGSINGSLVTSGINANNITTGSIKADRIAIGDYNNYITVTEKNERTLPSNVEVTQDGWLYKKVATDSNIWLSPVLSNWTTQGEQYRITGLAKMDIDGRCDIIIYGRDANGTSVSGAFVNTGVIPITANIETEIDRILTISNTVANQIKCNIAIAFYSGSSGSTKTNGYFKNLKCERMTGGSLLVEGSITTDKLAANAVTAGKINVDKLSAIAANMGTLTSGTIQYGTIGSNSSFYLSSSDKTANIAGASRAGLRLAVGSNFGVSNTGVLYASSVDLTGKITATSGKIGGINITNGKLDVSAINIGDLSGEIGGRNLILNSALQRVSSASTNGSTYALPNPTMTNYGDTVLNNTNDYYTYSFDYEVVGNTASDAFIYVLIRGTGVSGSSKGYASYVKDTPIGKHICTFKLSSAQATVGGGGCKADIRLRNASDGAILTIKNIKLEKGTKATDWTPAPEDIDVHKYITDIDSNKGITIKPADTSGNDYLQMNSSAINFYRNNVETLKIEDSAIRVGKLGNKNVYITDSAVQIRNNTSILAEYGSDIILGEVGTNKKNIYISPQAGLDIRNNTTSLANFGDTVRIGRNDHTNIQIASDQVEMTAPNGSPAMIVSYESNNDYTGAIDYGIKITDENDQSAIRIVPTVTEGDVFDGNLEMRSEMARYFWELSNGNSMTLEEGGFSIWGHNSEFFNVDSSGAITVNNQQPLIIYEDVQEIVSYSAGTIGTRAVAISLGAAAKSGYRYVGATVLHHSNSSSFWINLVRNANSGNVYANIYRASTSAVDAMSITVRKMWVHTKVSGEAE